MEIEMLFFPRIRLTDRNLSDSDICRYQWMFVADLPMPQKCFL